MTHEPDVRWSAWHTWVACLGAALQVLVATALAAAIVWLDQGALKGPQTQVLLGMVYWGVLPLVVVGMGAVIAHRRRSARGRQAPP